MEKNEQACTVIQKREFYSGTLGADSRPRPISEADYDSTSDNSPYADHVFDSAEAARAWIAGQESQTYYLAHGEAGRPEYWIVPADEDDWLAAICRDDSLIDWDNCSCIEADGDPCGDCEKCYAYMDAKIEEHLRRAEINEEEAAS